MSMVSILDVVESPINEEKTFVYRFPLLNNSLGIGTKLIVKSNQVAVFAQNGEVFDVFKEGTHFLSVNSLPLLAEHRKWNKKFNSKFSCDIYFVSLSLFENIKWAMVNSLILRDNDFGSVPIKCFGNFSFRIANASLFMKQLFGKISEFNNEDISLYLRTLVVTGITSLVAEKRFSALDFVNNYEKLEMNDYKVVLEKFALHGLFLEKINIENITVPEEIEKLVTEKAKEHLNQSFPVNHPINSGVGLTEEMKNMFNFTHDLTVTCINCGATIARHFKYCPQCGAENKEIAKECPKCHNVVAFKANFCPECGTKLFDNNNVVICKHCGKIVSEDDVYCPDCGKLI